MCYVQIKIKGPLANCLIYMALLLHLLLQFTPSPVQTGNEKFQKSPLTWPWSVLRLKWTKFRFVFRSKRPKFRY